MEWFLREGFRQNARKTAVETFIHRLFSCWFHVVRERRRLLSPAYSSFFLQFNIAIRPVSIYPKPFAHQDLMVGRKFVHFIQTLESYSVALGYGIHAFALLYDVWLVLECL
jgi:hypothetical protein